jgi:CHASE2 domain-containing sensor protein
MSKVHQSKKMLSNNIPNYFYDSLEYSDPALTINARSGFGNLQTYSEYREVIQVCRSFNPTMKVNGKTEYAFATLIAMQFDSLKAKKFLDRTKEEEFINFRFNADDETLQIRATNPQTELPIEVLDVDDVLNESFRREQIEGKIVLMGYVGGHLGVSDLDSKFFTPLNRNPVSRSRPDMYGTILHANIISMILNEDYVNELPAFDTIVINFYLLMLHIGLLLWIRKRWAPFFDVLATLIIFIQIVLFSVVRKELYFIWNYRIFFDLSIFWLAIAGIAINIYLEMIPALKSSGQKFINNLLQNKR